MASVFFRGPKASPRWFARFKTESGTWRSRRVRVQTRADAGKIARQLEAQSERRRYGIEAPESAGMLVGDLMKRWENGLVNRSAYDDRSRLRLHVLPRFGSMRLIDLTLPVLMTWLDELRTARTVGPATQRHLLNLVSRFFGWAIGLGFATVNPVRMIPPGKRPQHAPKRDVPWIADDDQVRAIMRELPDPFRLMFYVGNRAGMRLGEICGLRLSDVADLAAGAFRVRYSYTGPPQGGQDRRGQGEVDPGTGGRRLPCSGPWIERRRAERATRRGLPVHAGARSSLPKEHVEYRWELGCGGDWGSR